MATEGGRDSATLKELLLEKPGRFEFIQAVRLLQRIWHDRRGVGGDSDPSAEVVRFRSDLSLAFPGTDISDAVAPDDDGPGSLTVAFMGVACAGTYGALPRRYAEEIRKQVRNKNTAPRDFLDIFNHRLVSLFYRSAEKYRLVLAYESGRENGFEHALYAVLGLGMETLRGRLGFDERMLVARGGLLAMRPMPVSALESVLLSIFGQPVRIEQFIPQSYSIEEDDQNRLGAANARLGEDLYLGSEITLHQSKFRVRLGPLTREVYHEFLPHRPSFRSLAQVVRFAVEEGLEFDLQLVLKAAEVPPLRIGEPGETSPRLGWSTWLAGDPFEEPADDACFDVSQTIAAGEHREAA